MKTYINVTFFMKNGSCVYVENVECFFDNKDDAWDYICDLVIKNKKGFVWFPIREDRKGVSINVEEISYFTAY